MTTPKQIFDSLYDNDNKICTRKSLWEQFKEINREWLQQKEIPPEYGHKDIAYKMCKRQIINKFIKECLEELK